MNDPNKPTILTPEDRAKAAEVARSCIRRAASMAEYPQPNAPAERLILAQCVAAWLEAAERADKISRGPLP
jgi:hypothetical protein